MKNIIEIKRDNVLLDEKEMKDVASTLLPYVTLLQKAAGDATYGTPEASLHLPFDVTFLNKTETLAREFINQDLKYVFVVGIGGSSLGAQAVYEAEYLNKNALLPRKPKLHVVDMTNPRESEALKEFLKGSVEKLNELVINIVTKSGTTTETLANAALIASTMENKFGEKETLSRFVITTDEGSPMAALAAEKGIKVLPIPARVGGRYSVFSCAALLPLRLVGIQIKELLNGAEEAAEKCFLPELENNPALLTAVIAYLSAKKHQTIYNTFFFHSEMESLGKWWRQLVGESLGKNLDKEGHPVNAGLTPLVSIGSADLHSMVQMYLGGARDKFTNFVSVAEGQKGRVSVPAMSPFKNINPPLFGKDFADISQAILSGTLTAYKIEKVPFIETILPDVSAFSIGVFMQTKMIETMLLAKLWNVDAFNQPNVESYKKVTRELLNK